MTEMIVDGVGNSGALPFRRDLHADIPGFPSELPPGLVAELPSATLTGELTEVPELETVPVTVTVPMLRPVHLPNPPGDIAATVSDAVNGDPRAVERLLAHVRPLVVRYCRARVGRQERSFASADDVAQEVCLAVLTALPSYRDQGRPFLAFVYGIAAHKVADAHRAAARNRSEPVADVPDEPDEQAGPEQRAMRGELSGEMAELLKVLPPKQREIVVLRVVVGLSAEETADAVGSTPGAVRVAQHRALTRLRAALPTMYRD
jgi:RNA polymerase sigma-70 factor (ECF subfamily)